MIPKQCPKCKSHNIRKAKATDYYWCMACDHEWLPKEESK